VTGRSARSSTLCRRERVRPLSKSSDPIWDFMRNTFPWELPGRENPLPYLLGAYLPQRQVCIFATSPSRYHPHSAVFTESPYQSRAVRPGRRNICLPIF